MSTRAYGLEVALGATVAPITLTGVGTNEALLISSASVCNPNAVSQLLTMNLASGGAAAGVSNLIEYQTTLPAKKPTSSVLAGKTIPPGGKLYAGCDATGTVLSISGTVISQAQ